MLRLRARRLIAAGPRAIARKVAGRVTSRWTADAERRRALRDGTRATGPPPALRALFDRVEPGAFEHLDVDMILAVADHFVAHRFDLLGSGWVRVAHGIACRGLEGLVFPPGPAVDPDREGRWLGERIAGANIHGSRRTWSLVDDGYVPIDWQLDFKSGYRWDERLWHRDIRYGDVRGADVKVPWELARGQHLPELAIAHGLVRSGRGGSRIPEVYAREVRNQILDFTAQNPPGFGVNWSCTMDVAIRVANWIVALDLLRSEGASFDDAFEDEFARSVLDHAVFIAGHLEWEPTLRANHYLADIVGLLFCAAVLPRSSRTAAWLAFAVRELDVEARVQFHPDGSNFEASTCYHCFSAEMLAYATAIVTGLPDDRIQALSSYDHRLAPSPPGLRPSPIGLSSFGDHDTPFDRSYIERLERAGEFIVNLTKSDGRIPQIGDNDSGRLLKLPARRRAVTVAEAKATFESLTGYDELADEDVYWVEDHLDRRDVVSAIDALFIGSTGSREAERFPACVIAALARERRFERGPRRGVLTATGAAPVAPPARWRRETVFEVPDGGGTDQLETHAYPYFGVYVMRSRRVFVAVRCGPVGQNGNGGHAHNDQLSVTVSIDGRDGAYDPGSYLYTPLLQRRNEYRSVRAHNTPRCSDAEPARLDEPFRLEDAFRAECMSFGPEGFVGRHRAFGGEVIRRVSVHEDAVRILDAADDPLDASAFASPVALSPGYGLRLRGDREA